MRLLKTDHDIRILIVPGCGGSDQKHWDHHWQAADSRVERVGLTDPSAGTMEDWVLTLDTHIKSSPARTLLVAHSLGNIAVAHWAATCSGPIAGALLVAPADIEDNWANDGGLYASFRPIPMKPLWFPSFMVASTNDPYLSQERANSIAHAWRSELRILGPFDHLGSEAELGVWETGINLLNELIAKPKVRERI